MIDKNSRILFWVFGILLLAAILFSAYRFLIVRNFFIDISQLSEQPSEEVEESNSDIPQE